MTMSEMPMAVVMTAESNCVMLRTSKAAGEVLLRSALQIKVMAGGGVSSRYDPLDVTQHSGDEIPAAVAAAEDWGTHVTVHAYTPRAVQTALRAGVRWVEHGQLLDEETVKIMADKGVW